MKRSPESTAPVAITAVAVLFFAVLAAYVTGYFGLCRWTVRTEGERYRLYAAQWQATIYQPAAHAESLVTGVQVEACSPSR